MLRFERPLVRVLVGAILGISACKETVTEPIGVAAVVVNGGGGNLRLGQSVQLSTTLKSTEGWTLPNVGVSWASSDAAKASISVSGQVTAVSRGPVTLTASAGGVNGTAAVTVIGVQSVALAPETLSVIVTQTRAMTATTVLDPGVTVTPVWRSLDTTIARVDTDGRVTATSTTGIARIEVTAEDKKDTAVVRVVPVPVASVTVTPATATLAIGATRQLTATLKDSAGGTIVGRAVEWSSSDTAKATVSSGGLVMAKAAGNASITATSEGRSATSTISIAEIVGSSKSEWTTASGGNGSVYQIFVGQFTWRQADSIARSQRHNDLVGHLATTTTSAEFNFVTSLAAANLPSTSIVFLGGYQDRSLTTYSEPAGGWRWVTNETWSYTNWMSGEPNNSCCTPAQSEDYLSLYLRLPGNPNSWNDVPDDVGQFGYPTALVVEFTISPVTEVRSCKDVQARSPASVSGLYSIYPDGTTLSQTTAYCDMTTDGGGWTKVLGHKITNNTGRAAPATSVSDGLRLAAIDSGMVSDANLSTLRDQIKFSEIRFLCSKPSRGRTLHLKTSNLGVLDWLTRRSNVQPASVGSFTKLGDDTSVLTGDPLSYRGPEISYRSIC